MREYNTIDVDITQHSDDEYVDGISIRLCQDIFWVDGITTQLDAYKEFIKKLLMVAGFAGFEKEWLFCESVTGEEYEYLEQKLKEYRQGTQSQITVHKC